MCQYFLSHGGNGYANYYTLFVAPNDIKRHSLSWVLRYLSSREGGQTSGWIVKYL